MFLPHIYTLSLHDALPISHGLALEVVSVYVIARSGQGIKPDQLLSNRIPQPLRDHIARLALILLSGGRTDKRSEEHTSELQSHSDLVCRLLLEKKKTTYTK